MIEANYLKKQMDIHSSQQLMSTQIDCPLSSHENEIYLNAPMITLNHHGNKIIII
jgi:hypothetical protein